jgi:SAM-dependent methyltransferase
MNFEYPKNFARFYDQIYHFQRDGVDNEYFLNEVLKTNGRKLEIGVGTGRLFCNALKHGSDIYGIDISQSMLDVLFNKIDSQQHHRINLQNIIDFHFDFKFNLAIAPFRVIMHLLDKKDQLLALNNVYKHLEKNGRFIFDVFIPDMQLLINGIDNQVDYEGEYEPGKKIRRIVSTKPDLLNQIINVNFRLEWDEDNELKIQDWSVPLRYYFRYELEHLIERSMFGNYQILGDYQGNELNNDSKEFVAICTREH